MKETVSQKYLSCYESISRLVKSGLMEVKCDTDTPSCFLSLSVYRSFLCDKTGVFLDDAGAAAFLDKVRFYINLTRAYASGLTVANLPEELVDDSRLRFPPLDAKAWINLYVASSDKKSILLFGRWNVDIVDIRPYKEAPSTDANIEEI